MPINKRFLLSLQFYLSGRTCSHKQLLLNLRRNFIFLSDTYQEGIVITRSCCLPKSKKLAINSAFFYFNLASFPARLHILLLSINGINLYFCTVKPTLSSTQYAYSLFVHCQQYICIIFLQIDLICLKVCIITWPLLLF